MSDFARGQSTSSLREIVFDTETTGFSHATSDRIIDIGCVEVIDQKDIGRTWQAYINPQRDIPRDSFEVHGLDAKFLSNKPLFKEIVDDFLEFIGDSPLIAHNARFDISFIDAELRRLGRPPLQNRVIDTIVLGKKRFPGRTMNLDRFCSYLGVDTTIRTKHGALLDSELLARAYIRLRGNDSTELALNNNGRTESVPTISRQPAHFVRPARPIGRPSPEELERHQAMVETLKNPTWSRMGM